MTELDIYLWTRLSELRSLFKNAALVLTFITGVGFFLSSLFLVMGVDQQDKAGGKAGLKVSLIFGILLFILSFAAVMTPTTQQYAFIKVFPKVVNSEFVTGTLPKEAKEMYDMAKQYLKEITTQTR